MAAPSSEDSSTRRRALPKVYPKPRASGSTMKRPRFSPTGSYVLCGVAKSNKRPSYGLLGVQLDDERLLDRDVDVGALGQTKDLPHHIVVVRLQPGRHRRGQVGGVLDDRLQAFAAQNGRDDLVGPDSVR